MKKIPHRGIFCIFSVHRIFIPLWKYKIFSFIIVFVFHVEIAPPFIGFGGLGGGFCRGQGPTSDFDLLLVFRQLRHGR